MRCRSVSLSCKGKINHLIRLPEILRLFAASLAGGHAPTGAYLGIRTLRHQPALGEQQPDPERVEPDRLSRLQAESYREGPKAEHRQQRQRQEATDEPAVREHDGRATATSHRRVLP